MVFQVNVPVGPAKEGETAPRRFYKVKDGAVSRPVGFKCSTVYEFILQCAETHGKNAICHGWRDLLEIHTETKQITKVVDGEETKIDKKWQYYELSDYKYLTYGELLDLIHNYGKGLVKLGVNPNNSEKFHIFASTTAKWMQTYLATQTQGIPIVTAYDTLGEEGLTHSLVQTDSVGIFTDNDLLVKLINPLQKANHIRYVIHSQTISPDDKRDNGNLYNNAKKALDKLKEVRPDIQILSFDEILKLGKDNKDEIPVSPPKPDDLSCIMYTSGSTGVPKGVILTHKNIIAGLGGISVNISREFITNKDRIIGFLPLAHIFELAFELICFYWGGIMGYAGVKTLTDLSVKNCEGDMKTFKPTVMVGVATVWETIRKGILTNISKASPTAQKVFWAAFKAKTTMKKYSIPGTGVIDNVIFKKIKQATGGHLKILLNGGSPVSGSTQRFISNVIAPMLIGYGLTETVANTCILDPFNFEYDVAGALVGSVTVKLIDVPEAGYFAKNNQGEVLISGLPVMQGYYKNDKDTSEAFNYDKDYFSTGDIGEWTETGQLKLIDRKKNLVKTANGEYIALEKLESSYRANSLVVNLCCYADETKVKPIAIVVPNEQKIKELAIELGIAKDVDHVELHELIENKKVVSKVYKSILETGKAHNLQGIELIQGIVLVDFEWTPESGYVTSAQKLQRKKILASVKERVDQVYASS